MNSIGVEFKITFYLKNGFTENLKYKKKKDSHTISVRKDIFVEE